jgi:hypothetical protein
MGQKGNHSFPDANAPRTNNRVGECDKMKSSLPISTGNWQFPLTSTGMAGLEFISFIGGRVVTHCPTQVRQSMHNFKTESITIMLRRVIELDCQSTSWKHGILESDTSAFLL